MKSFFSSKSTIAPENEDKESVNKVYHVDIIINPSLYLDPRNGFLKTHKGEYTLNKNDTEFPALHRLYDHIVFLFRIAAIYQQRFFSQEKNTIVRMITPEFYFYLNHHPLTLEEFNLLLNSIKSIANQCSQNVHIDLGTLAVKVHEKIYNTAIYIQCGPTPVTDLITKSRITQADPSYEFYRHHEYDGKKFHAPGAQKAYSHETVKNHNANLKKNIKETYSIENEILTFNFNTLITSKTANNSEFFISNAICCDHGDENNDFENLLHSKAAKNELLPTCVLQTVIADAVEINNDGLLTEDKNNIMLVESVHASTLNPSNPSPIIEQKNIDVVKEALSIYRDKYATTSVTIEENKIMIQSPIFGYNAFVTFNAKKLVPTFKSELLEKIQQHNEHARKNARKNPASPRNSGF